MCQTQCLRPDEIFLNAQDKVPSLQELPGHLERGNCPNIEYLISWLLLRTRRRVLLRCKMVSKNRPISHFTSNEGWEAHVNQSITCTIMTAVSRM